MSESPWDLFFDLHGVLADGKAVQQNYVRYLERILTPTGITAHKIIEIHKDAHKRWIKEFRRISHILEGESFNPTSFMGAMRRIDRDWELFILDFIPLDQRKIVTPHLQTSRLEYEAQAYGPHPILFPEVITVLKELKKVHNLSLHIASSASSPHIKGIVTRHNLDRFFKTLIGYDTVEAPKKARSGLYFKKMLELTQVNPSRSIFVGDSIEEAMLAIQAGIKFIMVCREQSSPKRETSTLEFNILSNLTEILPILQNYIKNDLV